MAKVLMKGNEAVGAAAIEAGCKYVKGITKGGRYICSS